MSEPFLPWLDPDDEDEEDPDEEYEDDDDEWDDDDGTGDDWVVVTFPNG